MFHWKLWWNVVTQRMHPSFGQCTNVPCKSALNLFSFAMTMPQAQMWTHTKWKKHGIKPTHADSFPLVTFHGLPHLCIHSPTDSTLGTLTHIEMVMNQTSTTLFFDFLKKGKHRRFCFQKKTVCWHPLSLRVRMVMEAGQVHLFGNTSVCG